MRKERAYRLSNKGEDIRTILERDASLEYKKQRREERTEDSGERDSGKKNKKKDEFEDFNRFYHKKRLEHKKRQIEVERRQRRDKIHGPGRHDRI